MQNKIFKFLPLSTRRLRILSARNYTTKIKSSNEIRQQFLDFFIKENGHHFVKSSSVIPYCDPTLSFTNAGMNQFKNILLGNQDPKYRRVANSQKCIRVGGKHNDLSVVGTDTYHHTFFEMLGNWSFGDYFKKEACEMAWRLLTEVYKIPKERLYVTYFKGDENMGLKADLECRDIWLQLGVHKSRVVPFGAKENFWEMAKSGPCGGCTEIHIDHLPSYASENRAHDVNRDKSDLTELWNLVFIENFRKPDGTIENLREKHVDTGMGFERLVAFLQEKSSNYDTDLFIPIMKRIQEVTKMPAYEGTFEGEFVKRDTSYRVIADHSRMIAVSLADGMFPDQNQKLRRVLRKCIIISEKHFGHDNLLNSTIPVVAEILGQTFPELTQKLFNSLDILKYEQDLFRSLRDSMTKGIREVLNQNHKLAELNIYEYPGFIQGYNEFKKYKKSNSKEIDGEMAFQLYSTYGLDTDLIERLAELEGMTVDLDAFEDRMNQMKLNNETHFNEEVLNKFHNVFPPTNDESKHNYEYDKSENIYKVKKIKSKIVAIFDGENLIENSKDSKSENLKIILSETPFYCESGGQESDEGSLLINNIKYPLKSLAMQRNFIIHEISKDSENSIKIGDEIELEVDNEKRSANIRNHTATHILNSAVRKIFKLPTYQKSSAVSSNHLKIELAILGTKINEKNLEDLEKFVKNKINENLEKKIRVINSQELESESNVIMVPGEIYPDAGIRVINFGDFSKELCCGTHAFNTSELIDFTFLNVKSTGRSTYAFTAITGAKAREANKKGEEILSQLEHLRKNITIEKFSEIMSEVRKIQPQLNKISHLKKLKCLNVINEIKEEIKQKSRDALSELLSVEMEMVKQKNQKSPFVIHFLSCSDFMQSVSLEKATKYVDDKPVIILSRINNEIKARCVVPHENVDVDFDAEKWLSVVGKIFKSKVENPRGQNPLEICFMKAKKVKPELFDEQLEDAIENAKKFAIKNC